MKKGGIIVDTEKQLLSLINASQVLTSTLDLEQVLDKLIKEVLTVIEGADAGVLFMYDKKSNRLIAENAIGYNIDYLKKIHLASNEGMTGKVFYQKKAIIFHSSGDVIENMSDLFPKYEKNYMKAVGTVRYPKSAICAPMISKQGDCIGVLTIVTFSGKTDFTQADLNLLKTFANQAVIAIENATLFTQNERSKRINEALSYVSISKRGLGDVTSTLANLINQKVGICNEFFDLLACSSEEAKEIIEETKQKYQHELKQSLSQSSMTRLDVQLQSGNVTLYLFSINMDVRPIGLLTVIMNDNASFDPLDMFAVEQTNTIFALELAGQEKSIENHFKYEGYLLQQLLNRQFDTFKSKDFCQEKNYMYVEITLKKLNDLPEKLNEQQQYFSKLLYREIQTSTIRMLVVEKNLGYSLLVMLDEKLSEDEYINEVKQFFNKLHEQSLQRKIFDMQVGLGRIFEKIEEIESSYRDAQRCIEYLKVIEKNTPIISYRQLGPYRLFLQYDRIELQEYVDLKLGPLIRYDQKNGTELLKTLTIYIEANQNMTQTAKRSFVHLNTIKYRLKTIQKVLNIEHFNGKELFELHLCILIHAFLEQM